MSRSAVVLIALTVAGIGFGACSRSFYHPVDRAGEPVIRVGLLDGVAEASVLVGKSFSIYSPEGRFLRRVTRGHRWRVTILETRPARVHYRLRYWMTANSRLAFQKAHELAKRRVPAEIYEEATPASRWRIEGVGKKVYHVVARDVFETAEAAERRRKELIPEVYLQLMEVVDKPAGGRLLLSGIDTDQHFELESGSRLVVERFALKDIPVGKGFHWESVADRVFRGDLELAINPEGRLVAINVLPLEQYLQGVVPSEMHGDFPGEALKAQAVAARSQVLVKVARAPHGQLYDICATVHCQVYSGVMREQESTTRAVEDTRGLVLRDSLRIIEAVFSGVCGGHTESNHRVWSSLPDAHLQGIFDGDGASDLLDTLLTREELTRRWIDAKPPVYCNTQSGEVPQPLRYTARYFRWTRSLPRKRLEWLLAQQTGQVFGELMELRARRRGVSGRVTRLEVVGTLKSFVIDGELAIRKALADSTLYSTCFYVETEQGPDGLPVQFIFHGAGWGHGVGMCQTGAAVMAYRGATMEDILRRYYSGAEISAAY